MALYTIDDFLQEGGSLCILLTVCIQLFQLRLSRRKGKRSNMSAKGLSGKTSFIPEYITIRTFSSLKLDLAFL